MFRLGLHHLETLFWIDRLGSFAAAAERLNTTQSGISSRVRELEARLKTRVFQKEGRRMLLTLRGRDLVRRCEPLLQQVNGVLLSVTDEAYATGTVRLGLDEIAAAPRVFGFVHDVAADMPHLNWDLIVDAGAALRQKIADGVLDMGIVSGPLDAQELVAQPVGETGLAWMASATYFAARQDRVSLHDGPIWALPRPSHHHLLTTSMLREAGLPPSGINACNHVQAMIDIVRAGAGIGMLPEHLVGEDLARGVLRRLDIEAAPHALELHAVRRRDEADPVVLRVFERASRRLRSASPDAVAVAANASPRVHVLSRP